MTNEASPYDVMSYSPSAALSLGARLTAGFVGALVFLASAGLLGVSLLAVLEIIEGRTQPAPIAFSALVKTSQQRIVLAVGGILVAGVSILLARYVVLRILKSQRLIADVALRRRELQVLVGQMREAVRDQKQKDAQSKTTE